MFSRIKRIFREYKELRYLAYHDSLTGLYNRNWLYKNIGQIKTKYVYFININDLHKINERGHLFGDDYIKNIVNNINHSGILLRYAGDEFILFSNNENEIKTNQLYSVGCALITKSINESIKIADYNMIQNKFNYKSNLYTCKTF